MKHATLFKHNALQWSYLKNSTVPSIHKFTKKTAKRIIQKEVESFKIQRSPPTCIRIGVHRSLSEPSHMLAGHPQGRPRPLLLSQAFLSFESSWMIRVVLETEISADEKNHSLLSMVFYCITLLLIVKTTLEATWQLFCWLNELPIKM